MKRRRGFIFFVSLAALANVLLVACSSSSNPTPTGSLTPGSTPPTSSATSAPEEALSLYVQRRLSQRFVAKCEDAKRPDDIGKQCARKLGERNGMLAYALGPAFGDYTRIMILKQEDGVWTIAQQVSRDPDQPAIPGVPWPLEVGADVVVVGTAPDCLKIREQPTTAGTQLGCLEDGSTATVVAGPVDADDIQWWQLEDQGWAASDYLRYPDDTSVPPAEGQ
jgi:hypothetical protein